MLAFFNDEASAAAGAKFQELRLPGGASTLVIVRGDRPLAMRGTVRLGPVDRIYVLTHPEDEALVHILLSHREA